MIRVCMSLGMHESWVSSRRTNEHHVTPEIKSANDGFYLHCFPAGFLPISNYSPRKSLPGWLYCVPPSRTVSVSSKKWKQCSRTVLVWCQLRVYLLKGKVVKVLNIKQSLRSPRFRLVWTEVLMSGIAFSHSWLVKYTCEFLLESEGNRSGFKSLLCPSVIVFLICCLYFFHHYLFILQWYVIIQLRKVLKGARPFGAYSLLPISWRSSRLNRHAHR